MAATYRVLVDWTGNAFGDNADDVSADVLDERTQVSTREGRNQARQFSPIEPGSLDFELNNTSGDYSPENSSSPLSGYVAAGRSVRLQAVNAGSVTNLFCGYLDDFDVKPGLNDESVPVTCIDALGRLRGQKVTSWLYQGIRTGDAIGVLLDKVGWPPEMRDLDIGVSYLPFWWLDDSDAFDALMQLVDSEGGPALVGVNSQGCIVFRDRHHRLTRSASLTAQATWRSSGVEPVISEPVTYNHGWKEIVNSASVDVLLRTIDTTPSVVWSSQGQISVAAGVDLVITARASGPFRDAQFIQQDVDYTLITGSVSIVWDQDSGQSLRLTLSSAGGAVLQDLQLRAYAVQSTTVVVSAEDPVSVGKYGRRAYSDGRLPVWANAYDAEAILDILVARRSERVPTVSVTMRGAAHPLRLTECLTRNLSDRIHLTESLTGLDSDCFIEQIAHTVTQGGLEHVTTFGLEKTQLVVSTPFTFDVAGRGFDDGRFASGALDNPATMFRFDTPGQGFDDGVFSY